MPDQLAAKVITPQRVVFDGPIAGLSALNSKGRLSILPGHANFISLIQQEVVLFPLARGKPKRIPVQQGVLHCRNNKIEVYIGINSGGQVPA